jgi:hypothetical protein
LPAQDAPEGWTMKIEPISFFGRTMAWIKSQAFFRQHQSASSSGSFSHQTKGHLVDRSCPISLGSTSASVLCLQLTVCGRESSGVHPLLNPVNILRLKRADE